MLNTDAHTDPLVSYRLGAVRTGLQATVLALLVLIVFRLMPGHGKIHDLAYIVVIVSASLGAIGVKLLPWKRLFSTDLGVKALYAWSVLDILLITVAIGFTGGGQSEMFILYALTTVFFGAAYPTRGQVALLLFTFASYLGVLALTGWDIAAGTVFIRCGVLAIVALLVSFLATQLLRHIDSLQEERSRAERWATVLSEVATSARQMTLDRDAVLASFTDSVIGLGLDAAAVCIFDHETETFVVTHPRGLPDEYVLATHSATEDVPGLVRATGEAVVLDEGHASPQDVAQPLLDAGFNALIASPVWLDGWLAGALLGAKRDGRSLPEPEVEAFQLLAGQIGLAVENAQRFEETLHTVERLEELDRLKDDFLATASHEIRTPLTVIMGSGATLEQRWADLDDTMRLELLKAVNRNARALDGLIASLLDFARLGAEGQNVARQPTDVGGLAVQVAMRLAPLFKERPLEVLAEELLLVEADQALIERVIENLLSNAAKHTPVGTQVLLSARSDDGTALVAVQDDGPGIPEDEVFHLGERFYRGGDLNARTKGLGLGLALSGEILELHGSALEIETHVGIGSTFAFRLPIVGIGENPFAAAMRRAMGDDEPSSTEID
ncbi:MAG TPA: ATP-binding protein [Actinomycetota bacterium]|nr:ATP-binding protein [Actinomycetota bacterium]